MMWMTRHETKAGAKGVSRDLVDPGDYNSGMRVLPALALALATALAGCATPQEITPPDKIPVYESVTGSPRVATVVKRIWADSWMTALTITTYRSAEEGAADLKEQASALGGNGIINFGCYPLSDDESPLIVCNGTVVRFK